jgi:hypothetical protein
MPATYEPIATNTLGSTTASVTFSSIPSTYTDLVLSMTYNITSGNIARIRFNSDSGSNYAVNYLVGTGASAYSTRQFNLSYIDLAYETTSSGSSIYTFTTVDIFNYSSSTLKTTLTKTANDLNGSGSTEVSVGRWNSTSAITSIEITAVNTPTQQFRAGSTFTLYGVKNA